MKDYLGSHLIGKMESSKIIDEVYLFRNRPRNCDVILIDIIKGALTDI